MGDALPRPGRSPMALHPAGRAVVPKERFFLMLNGLFVSHDQNIKDG